jgi:signal transduction histidine kinase
MDLTRSHLFNPESTSIMAKHRLESVNRYLWHQRAIYHDAVLSLPWWRSPFFGYLVGLLLVLLTMVASLLVREPHFVWAPFCLLFVIVGFVWGVGPALATIALGFLAFTFVVAPQYNLFTWNAWHDIMLLGPFVIAQFIIALLASYNAVQYRRLLKAKQEIDASAQQLAASNQQLERANHLKDLFLIRAAHELRTPLTTILGEAQLARRSLKKAERTGTEALRERSHFEKIEARALELRALLEALIDLSRFRAEEVPLRFGPCDFGTLCREVIEDQRTVSGRTIAFTRPSDPVILQADCVRLSQVVINVVKNAIEYAQDIILQVQNDALTLLCHEPPEQLSPYAEAMFGEGWGLGLTMSQAIVERHGGHMWVEASDGTGVTCYVRLPLQAG